jgi:hypothetical protein
LAKIVANSSAVKLVFVARSLIVLTADLEIGTRRPGTLIAVVIGIGLIGYTTLDRRGQLIADLLFAIGKILAILLIVFEQIVQHCLQFCKKFLYLLPSFRVELLLRRVPYLLMCNQLLMDFAHGVDNLLPLGEQSQKLFGLLSLNQCPLLLGQTLQFLVVLPLVPQKPDKFLSDPRRIIKLFHCKLPFLSRVSNIRL